MIQRGPTHVVSSAGIRRLLAFHSEGGPPLEIADLITASTTHVLTLALSVRSVDQNRAYDQCVLYYLTVEILYLILWKGSYWMASLREGFSIMTVQIMLV
jgi:hypothetical protein